jgi:hypothetical protein
MPGLPGWWNDAATIVAVLAPLVAVHVTVVAIHLRTIREFQTANRQQFARRLDTLEGGVGRLREAVRRFERDYATKEEWLRESMAARRHIERLTEVIIRFEAQAEQTYALARRVDGAARAMLEAGPGRPGSTRNRAPADEPTHDGGS